MEIFPFKSGRFFARISADSGAYGKICTKERPSNEPYLRPFRYPGINPEKRRSAMKRTLQVEGTLVDDKVRFRATARDNPPVHCDFFPPIGTGQGYTGLEVLLMGLAVCSATTIAYLLRNAGKVVSGCEVVAEGTVKEPPAVGFESAVLHFNLTSSDAVREDMDRVLGLAGESACPVWQMVKGNFEITTDYRIRADI
jgi:putative redox protein